MKDIAKHQPQVRTSLVYSIGPAVDLAELHDYTRKLLNTPWHLQKVEPEPSGDNPFVAP